MRRDILRQMSTSPFAEGPNFCAEVLARSPRKSHSTLRGEARPNAHGADCDGVQLRETFRFMLEHPTAESIFPHNKVRARSVPDQHMLSRSLPSWAPIGLLAHERCSLGPLRRHFYGAIT